MTTHILAKTGDKNLPQTILDSNNEVILSYCKLCGASERELNDFTTCEDYEEYVIQEQLDRTFFL